MPNNAYFVLMQQSFQAHQRFHDVWREHARTGVLEKEAAAVTKAREQFIGANNELWNKLLDPLQHKFNDDRGTAVDKVIDFLEVDIPAFRCGYLKEYFLDHIKSVDLTDVQKKRLRCIALKLCEENTMRREFRRWIKLMISIADSSFVAELSFLARKQEGQDQRATILMLKKLAMHRQDLSQS